MELASGLGSAVSQQAYAEFQSGMMERQMAEINARTGMQIASVNASAEKVVAVQEAAFANAGVKLSGSAMSVVSDTMNDAAQAAYIRRREADYALMSTSIEKSQYDFMAKNEQMYLKMAGAGLGAAAGYGKDMYGYNKAHTGSGSSNRGAVGLGEDRAGGTTQASRDYLAQK
jgi:hypothetical protein